MLKIKIFRGSYVSTKIFYLEFFINEIFSIKEFPNYSIYKHCIVYLCMCICVVSPSLHGNTSLSNTTSPVSSVASSPSSSLDVKSQKSTPVAQDNKDSKSNKNVQKQKSIDSKKIICDAIEKIFCVNLQVSLFYKQDILHILYTYIHIFNLLFGIKCFWYIRTCIYCCLQKNLM